MRGYNGGQISDLVLAAAFAAIVAGWLSGSFVWLIASAMLLFFWGLPKAYWAFTKRQEDAYGEASAYMKRKSTIIVPRNRSGMVYSSRSGKIYDAKWLRKDPDIQRGEPK